MPLNDPIAIYDGADNFEVNYVRNLLVSAGIEAYATEDLTSIAGDWTGGLMPEMHKTQVWVNRADTERAAPIIAGYEQEVADRRGVDPRITPDAAPIAVTCEACGKTSEFPPEQAATVQSCPHCGAYVDVARDDMMDEWKTTTEDEVDEA